MLKETLLVAIAEEVRGSPAQVVLRWRLQLGVLPIPKSASASRQAESFAIEDFEMTAGQMHAISGLTRMDGRIFDADPATHEEF